MPELLKFKERTQLSVWIGRICHYELLYKISQDGCSATTFHQKCDNKGPTVTVLYNTNNTVYGGYLSQHWHRKGEQIKDENAFLFRLRYNGASDAVKMMISNAANAAYGHSEYGPTFGGYDIKTFTNNVGKSGKEYSLNGSLNLGKSFNANGQTENSIANGSLQVTDLEVYLVKDGSEIIDKPWRKHPDWSEEEMEELKQLLQSYKPKKESKVEKANILMVGQIGAGKSSFFNSANSVFCGKITSKACSGSFEHSVTTSYRKYEIKDPSTGGILNFCLCDTRGFEEELAMDGLEMSFMLHGNIPDRYQFNPSVPFNPESAGFIKAPQLGDKIHCVAFVIDGSAIDVMPEKVMRQLKDLQIRMNHRNIPQVVYLTKLDKVCPEVNDDVTTIYNSCRTETAVEKVAEMMGLPRGHVFPVKNYENESELDVGVNILVMHALQRTLDFADDYMDEQSDKYLETLTVFSKE